MIRALAVTVALGSLPQFARAEAKAAHAVSATPAKARTFQVGAALGLVVPRGELAPGPLLGMRGAIALDRSWTWAAFLNVDVARARERSDVMLSPPAFPRSAGQLDVRLDTLTIAPGVSLRVAAFGSMAVRVGMSAGVAIAHANLSAYQSSRSERCAAPSGTLEVMLVGRAGPVAWHGQLAWRESRCELAEANSSLDQLNSGALATVGASW